MLSLSRCEGCDDYPLLRVGHKTKEAWTISILSSTGDPWVNDWTICTNALCTFYIMKEWWRREVTLLVFRRGRSWVSSCTSCPVVTQEGSDVGGSDSERLSAPWLCHLVQVFRLLGALSVSFLPSSSQRVSTRVRRGNGPICVSKAALKRKCFIKDRDSKVSGPCYCVWLTKPLVPKIC